MFTNVIMSLLLKPEGIGGKWIINPVSKGWTLITLTMNKKLPMYLFLDN